MYIIKHTQKDEIKKSAQKDLLFINCMLLFIKIILMVTTDLPIYKGSNLKSSRNFVLFFNVT